MHPGTISIFQVINSQIGPVIGLSLSIMEDFSWILRYRGHVVPADRCSLLQNTPSLLCSGMLTNVIVGTVCMQFCS